MDGTARSKHELALHMYIWLVIVMTSSIVIASTGLACENIRFSTLFAAGDVLPGGTPATQVQKFHTDDPNQCLHNRDLKQRRRRVELLRD